MSRNVLIIANNAYGIHQVYHCFLLLLYLSSFWTYWGKQKENLFYWAMHPKVYNMQFWKIAFSFFTLFPPVTISAASGDHNIYLRQILLLYSCSTGHFWLVQQFWEGKLNWKCVFSRYLAWFTWTLYIVFIFCCTYTLH